MGYRSEVALAVSAELLPHLMAALAQSEKARNLVFRDHDSIDTNYGHGGLKVAWDYIKWYDSFEEVTCIENFMDEMDDMRINGTDADEGYRFFRVGENSDDVEERGYLESFRVVRSIEDY